MESWPHTARKWPVVTVSIQNNCVEGTRLQRIACIFKRNRFFETKGVYNNRYTAAVRIFKNRCVAAEIDVGALDDEAE